MPVKSENELCAHIDRMNSSKRECNQVIGSYYYKQLNIDGEVKFHRAYCGGRSMAACEKMASNAANIDRLCRDLIEFVEQLPDHRKALPPKCCDDSLRRYSSWKPKDGIVTGMHIYRTIFW